MGCQSTQFFHCVHRIVSKVMQLANPLLSKGHPCTVPCMVKAHHGRSNNLLLPGTVFWNRVGDYCGMHSTFFIEQGSRKVELLLFTIYYSVTLQTKETTYKLSDKGAEWMPFFTIASTSIIMSCFQLCSVINYYHSKSWQVLTNRAMSHNRNILVKKKFHYS